MKTERKWVFTWLDLVAPWGVCLGSIGLCIWAAIAGKPVDGGSATPAKVVSIATACVFAAAIPLWYFVRSRFRKFDLKLGAMYVTYGKKNRPPAGDMEAWTESVIQHWANAEWGSKKNGNGDIFPRSLSHSQVMKALDGVQVFLHDKEKLSVWGRFVRGFTQGKDIVIGYRDGQPAYVRSLWRHELSHPVLGFNGEGWDEKRHHQIFEETKLGA